MNRRSLLASLLAGGALPLLPRAWAEGPAFRVFHDVEVADEALARLTHDRSYWRDLVSESAWRVLFLEDTERPFSSPLDEHYADGTYICAACYLPLFSSATKYNSNTGWPSFWQPFDTHIGTKRDFKLIWPRTEYHCVRCGGHQGHVFNDGPQPTGQRWCNNGLALHFVPAGEPLPELRG